MSRSVEDFLQQFNNNVNPLSFSAPSVSSGQGSGGVDPQIVQLQMAAQKALSGAQMALERRNMEYDILDQRFQEHQKSADKETIRLTAELATITTQKTTAIETLQTRDGEVKTLTDEKTTLQAELDKLKLRVTELETDLAAKTKEATDLQAEVDGLKKTGQKRGAAKLGLVDGEGKTTQKGDPIASTTKARAATAGSDSGVDVDVDDKYQGVAEKFVQLETLSIEKGGAYTRAFMQFKHAHNGDILQAISLGLLQTQIQ